MGPREHTPGQQRPFDDGGAELRERRRHRGDTDLRIAELEEQLRILRDELRSTRDELRNTRGRLA